MVSTRSKRKIQNPLLDDIVEKPKRVSSITEQRRRKAFPQAKRRRLLDDKGEPMAPIKPETIEVSVKCRNIMTILDSIYPKPPVPLNYHDPFTMLVAVMLSAQTTDGRVNIVTTELFQRAPDPQSLARMPVEEVLELVRSVGLAPTKSKNLVAMAQSLVDNFGGQVPRTMKELQTLPGVGKKTASVLISQAFGEPAFAVDTHIHRLSLRWGLTKNEKSADKVSEELERQFPREKWTKLHLQMIYFGREFCSAGNHNSSLCPICSWVSQKDTSSFESSEALSLTKNPASPSKRRKGIVFYSDRVTELEDRPDLVMGPDLVT